MYDQLLKLDNYSPQFMLVEHSISFKSHTTTTDPFAEKELSHHGPVIHAQTVIKDQSLPRVGHHIFFWQEVVAKELLHPVELYMLYKNALYSPGKFIAATLNYPNT